MQILFVTYQDVHCGVPLVFLSVTGFKFRVLSVRFLDEVPIAEPGDFGLWVGVDVGLQDQDGGLWVLQLRLLIDPVGAKGQN